MRLRRARVETAPDDRVDGVGRGASPRDWHPQSATRGTRRGRDAVGRGLPPRARRRLPRLVFDFVDGAAESESTMPREPGGVRRGHAPPTRRHRPRADRPTDDPARSRALDAAVPRALRHGAPRAPRRRPCRGRGRRGGRDALRPLGDVGAPGRGGGRARRTAGPVWFQAYLVQDQPTTARAIARSVTPGHAALVITIDSAVGSLPGARPPKRRGRDPRLEQARPPRPTSASSSVTRRGSRTAVRDGLRPRFMNVLADDSTPALLGEGAPTSRARLARPPWIREIWEGPIVVKGVLTGRRRTTALARARRRSSSRTTAGASSTPPTRPRGCCPRSSRRSGAAARCRGRRDPQRARRLEGALSRGHRGRDRTTVDLRARERRSGRRQRRAPALRRLDRAESRTARREPVRRARRARSRGSRRLARAGRLSARRAEWVACSIRPLGGGGPAGPGWARRSPP